MSVRKPPIHTVPHDGGWAIEVEGEQRLGRVVPTEHEAVAAGRLRAQRDKTEHIIHREDGTIVERHNYAESPERPLGGTR
jgi:hypothetical protein